MRDTLIERVRAFNEARGWRSRHTLNQLAISLTIEASELLECFQWLREDVALERLHTDPAWRERLEGEIADVAIYLLALCDLAEVNLEGAVSRKLELNAERFPLSDGKRSLEQNGRRNPGAE